PERLLAMAQPDQNRAGTDLVQAARNAKPRAVLQLDRALGIAVFAFSGPRRAAESSVSQSIVAVQQGSIRRADFEVSILLRIWVLAGVAGADAQCAIRAKAELRFDGLNIIDDGFVQGFA